MSGVLDPREHPEHYIKLDTGYIKIHCFASDIVRKATTTFYLNEVPWLVDLGCRGHSPAECRLNLSRRPLANVQLYTCLDTCLTTYATTELIYCLSCRVVILAKVHCFGSNAVSKAATTF